MKSEIESMKVNDVWILVDLPDGVKPIGCKWVFKKKRSADEKVETYKVGLVVKNYSQHYYGNAQVHSDHVCNSSIPRL